MPNINFGQPDPAWPYYNIWQAATEINRNNQKLLSLLSSSEESTPEVDEQVKTLLIELHVQTQLARNTFVGR